MSSGTDTVTLVIAVIALVLSALSLTWQLASFLLTGPRVRVQIREALQGPRDLLVGPRSAYTEQGLRDLKASGYEEVLGVEAINIGRLPVTVQNWSFRFGNAATYTNHSDPGNPSLPHRLDSHSSAVWWAPRKHLEDLAGRFTDRSEKTARVEGAVQLAQKLVISKNKMTVR